MSTDVPPATYRNPPHNIVDPNVDLVYFNGVPFHPRTVVTSGMITAPGANDTVLTSDSTATPNGTAYKFVDHTKLLNKGTKTHTELDSFVNSLGQASGPALVDSQATLGAGVGPFLAFRHIPSSYHWVFFRDYFNSSNDGTLNEGMGPTIDQWTARYYDQEGGNVPVNAGFNNSTGHWTVPRKGVYLSDVQIQWPALASNGAGKFRQVSVNSTVQGTQLDVDARASILANKMDFQKLTSILHLGQGEEIYLAAVTFGNGVTDNPGDVTNFKAFWRMTLLCPE